MKTIYAFFVLLLSFGAVAQSQTQPTFTISTVVGSAPQVNIPGTSAKLGGGLLGVAVDSSGNLYFAVQDTVLRLDATTKTLSLLAGNGTYGFSGDGGAAANAQLAGPGGLAVDSTGNLYIADRFNNRIRKVANGVITTVAGNGTPSFGGDNGPATSAQLQFPAGIAVDSTGNLYIADAYNNRIRKVSSGVISTVAGNGTGGFAGDNGAATSAELFTPDGVTVDPAGNLYISDYANGRVRKVANGVITTVAGGGSSFGDGSQATSAQLAGPGGVAVDSSGNLYIADSYDNRIRRVSSGVISTVAGSGTAGFGGDNGAAASAELSLPSGIAVDSAGNLYIADYGNSSVRKVSGGTITTVAGNGTFSGDGGVATSSELANPFGIAVDSTGNLYVTDTDNNRLRKVSNGVITTAAGSGTTGYVGPAGNAQLFSYPTSLAMDSTGAVYVADTYNQRVRKVSNGVITTVAGNGTAGFSGDGGPATSAELSYPAGVAVDTAGNLYIADELNNRIRKVSGGVITTVAGNGTSGFSGDNGAAASAQLANPFGVAIDSSGNLYIADTSNSRIRKVSGGVMTTVAGTAKAGFSGDGGPAASAQLNFPTGLAADSSGNLYIADINNNRIREISNGTIYTIAGDGKNGFAGDNGPATSAELDSPFGVAVTAAGNVYIADTYNNRIRLLTPSALPTCTFSLSPTSLQSPSAGGSFSVALQTTAGCAWTISGLPSWITVSGATSGSGPGTVSLLIAANTGTAVLTATLTVAGVSLPVTEAAPTVSTGPTITAGGVVSASAFGGFSAVAPGSWVEIYGTNLASTTRSWTTADFNGNNAPTSLTGTSVTIGGQPAFIDYISPSQVNVQIPSNVATGPQPLTVTTATGTSAAYTINVNAAEPGLLAPTSFLIGGTQYVVALFTDGVTYVLPPGAITGVTSQRAKPGDTIVLYGVGFGATTPNIPAGQIAGQSNTLASSFQLSIGGLIATAEYSGLAPGFVGLYQFNVVVPNVPASDEVPVTFTLGATTGTQTIYIAVQN